MTEPRGTVVFPQPPAATSSLSKKHTLMPGAETLSYAAQTNSVTAAESALFTDGGLGISMEPIRPVDDTAYPEHLPADPMHPIDTEDRQEEIRRESRLQRMMRMVISVMLELGVVGTVEDDKKFELRRHKIAEENKKVMLDMKARITALEIIDEEQKRQLKDLRVALKAKEEKVASLSDELMKVNGKLALSKGELSEAKLMDKFKQMLSVSESRMETLITKTAAPTQTTEKIHSEIVETLREGITKSKAQLKALKLKHKAELETCEKKISKLTSEKSSLELSYRTLQEKAKLAKMTIKKSFPTINTGSDLVDVCDQVCDQYTKLQAHRDNDFKEISRMIQKIHKKQTKSSADQDSLPSSPEFSIEKPVKRKKRKSSGSASKSKQPKTN